MGIAHPGYGKDAPSEELMLGLGETLGGDVLLGRNPFSDGIDILPIGYSRWQRAAQNRRTDVRGKKLHMQTLDRPKRVSLGPVGLAGFQVVHKWV